MVTASFVSLLMATVEPFAMVVSTLMSFTVMAVAAFITMISMMMALAMMMPMVIAPGVRIILQSPFSKSFCGRIRSPLNPRIKPDTQICKRHLCTPANAAADQRISFHCLQKTSESAMPISVRVNNLFIYNPSIFYII